MQNDTAAAVGKTHCHLDAHILERLLELVRLNHTYDATSRPLGTKQRGEEAASKERAQQQGVTAVIDVDFLKLPVRRLELLHKLAVHHPGHVSVLGRSQAWKESCAAGVWTKQQRRSSPSPRSDPDFSKFYFHEGKKGLSLELNFCFQGTTFSGCSKSMD